MIQMAALRFLYLKTLKRPFRRDDLPLPKTPRILPTVLSTGETAHLIASAANLHCRRRGAGGDSPARSDRCGPVLELDA